MCCYYFENMKVACFFGEGEGSGITRIKYFVGPV